MKKKTQKQKRTIKSEEVHCPYCHKLVDKDAKICPYCGVSLIVDKGT
jgi:RNA polymerase subunit RPABC4/transcription elongation factor Spt4